MAKTDKKFIQNEVNLTAVLTAACVLGANDAPTNTVALQWWNPAANAGAGALQDYVGAAGGGLLSKLYATPRGTVSSADITVYLFESFDGGVTKRLIDQATIKIQTPSASVAPISAVFPKFTTDDPRRCQAGAKYYAGAATAHASGIVISGEFGEFGAT